MQNIKKKQKNLSMDRNIIIYIGNFDFPFGNASGKRVYGNGKLLSHIGYKVIYVGMNRELSPNVKLETTKKEFDGFEYYNFSYPRGMKQWCNYKSILREFILWMEPRKRNTSAIICYGSPRISRFIIRIARWAKKNDIKVISDCVDWLESRTGNFLFDIAKTVDTYYQKAIANRHVDGVICISSYLESYYRGAGKIAIVIPPLSIYIPKEMDNQENEIITFVYAGNAFRNVEVKECSALKDRVDKMMELLKLLKEKDLKFILFYYGVEKENYLTAFPKQKDVISYLGDSIKFCGYCSNDIVTERIKNSDFTFLVRDKKKSTMAGFPTKISESISCGTPVITTKTSDIEKYLSDGEMVIFIDQDDLEKSAQIIENKLQQKEYYQMKRNCAYNTIFYYEKFEKRMKGFLEKIL